MSRTLLPASPVLFVLSLATACGSTSDPAQPAPALPDAALSDAAAADSSTPTPDAAADSPVDATADAPAESSVADAAADAPTEAAADAPAESSVADAVADALFVCDPPAQPGEFYALSAQSLDRPDPVSMCEYRGKVVLISNIAAKCGYTPQLGVLATIYKQYQPQGFEILGFYSDQFGNQAGSKAEQEACQQNYGVTFEVFDVVNVNPPNEHPIFSWLKAQPGGAGDIAWNFEKFLIGRDGRFIARWVSSVEPDDPKITSAIEEAIAASP